MDFGVVVVTYNRLALLKECIDHLQNQTVQFRRICIVDNCSTDGTEDFLKELEDQNKENDIYQIIRLEENLGGAGGFSCGLKNIKPCDWVLIIDDDAMIQSDYIEKIRNRIEKEKYLAYSGSVYTQDRPDVLHRRRITNQYFMLYKNIPEYEYKKPYFECDISTFCGLVVKKSLVDKIGLPKTEYFIWFDDTEYSLRIGKFSKILNVNDAILDHRTKVNDNNMPVCWKSYYGFRNAVDIGKKYSKNKYVYQGYIYLNYITHIMLDTIFLKISKKSVELRKYRINIYKDALLDSIKGIMGKNLKYLPNRNIQCK